MHSYCVVYRYIDAYGNKRQKCESYKTITEARTRQKEIEYKERIGTFVIPQCKTMNELLTEYINLYGKNTWALSTYSSNVSTIDNYVRPLLGDMGLRGYFRGVHRFRLCQHYGQQGNAACTEGCAERPENAEQRP